MSLKAEECSLPGSRAAARPGKYLTFVLAGESYGIEILKVRSIIRPTPITPVPRMPPHILGIINLRGKIIPILDLRTKFGLGGAVSHERSCIIVIEVKPPDSPASLAGLIVDSVEEVVNLAQKDIEATPEFSQPLDARHILGLAKTGPAVKILLDLDQIFADER